MVKATSATSLKKTVRKARKTRILKPVKPAMPHTPEENLKRLAHSPILMNFVKKQNAIWNHQDWLAFLDELQQKGFFPINTDKVGLMLEDKKTAFLAR